jgi:hypothetical protein
MKQLVTCLSVACCMLVATPDIYAQPAQQQSEADSAGTGKGKNENYVRGITPGRARSLAGGVLGLISVVAGAFAVRKKGNRSTGKLAAVLGSLAVILSIIHLAGSAGAVFGSGSGKAGAIVAMVLGLTGAILGLMRMRRKEI